MHCILNLVIVNCIGMCMYALSGARGAMDEWELFQETDLYKNSHKYFRYNDRQVMLWDKSFSAHDWDGRVVSPYKK